MNERDKELAMQAGYTKAHHDEYGRLTVMPEFNREKFADLIRADEREKIIGEFVESGAVSKNGTIVTIIRARGQT